MVRRRVRSLLLVLPALFLLLLLPRAGQAQEGAISGTVTDLTGLGLSTVEVEVLRADGSVLAGDLSTTSGAFRITNVPTGTYTVQFTLAGWTIVEQENVVVRAGETTSVNAGLSERSFNLNPITVPARRSRRDPRSRRSTTSGSRRASTTSTRDCRAAMSWSADSTTCSLEPP